MNGDWRDGFLFVAKRPALDLLNTKPELDGALVDLLPDAKALARWLKAAGIAAKTSRLQDQLPGLKDFREKLRNAILRIEAGNAPKPAFVTELNALLLAHPYPDCLKANGTGLERVKAVSDDFFAPIVDDAAALLSMADPSRLRRCDACVLHFHDTSKKGTRRWCSMNLCGNRAKVAAYAGRKRTL